MPLTSSKQKHLTTLLKRARTGRTVQINLTLKASNNTTSVLTVPAIWRPVTDADPSFDPTAVNNQADIIASFLATDVTEAQLRSCIYAAPATPTASDPANRYLLTAINARGMVPDRYVCTFTRQR